MQITPATFISILPTITCTKLYLKHQRLKKTLYVSRVILKALFTFFCGVNFISTCVICEWIATLTGPDTHPLREALTINFIHVGGVGDDECSNAVIVFPVKGKGGSCLSN